MNFVAGEIKKLNNEISILNEQAKRLEPRSTEWCRINQEMLDLDDIIDPCYREYLAYPGLSPADRELIIQMLATSGQDSLRELCG
jgi:hypothetical protein